MTRLVPSRLRTSAVARTLALVGLGALLGGGGYAIAAGSSTSIHGCVDKRTGVLHVQKKCGRSQTRLVWNQQGPRGVPGAQGPQGAPAVSAWASVGSNGLVGSGHGITVQHVSPGVYILQAIPQACMQIGSAPVVTVSDSNPPAPQIPGTFVVAWAGNAPGGAFTINTGVVNSGTFTPRDETFNVVVPCS